MNLLPIPEALYKVHQKLVRVKKMVGAAWPSCWPTLLTMCVITGTVLCPAILWTQQ